MKNRRPRGPSHMSNRRLILPFLCVLLLPSNLCPSGHANAQTQAKVPAFTDYLMPPSGKVTVPAEGGLNFEMKVDAQGPFPTVFDTGAINVMSTSLAARLALKIEETSTDFGAIGGSVKVRTAHGITLSIGGLLIRNQTFYVLDVPPDAGAPQLLVGWELMQRFAVRMDFTTDQLTFFDERTFHYAGTGDAVPLLVHKEGNGIDVKAKVDGIEGRFLLDSGNQTGLFLNASFVAKHNLVKALGARYRGYDGRGFGGPSPEAWFVRLHTFQIASIQIAKPMARLQTKSDSFDANLAGNIGQDILNRFVVTIDCPHATMYLEKTAAWNEPGVFNRAGLVVDFNEKSDEVKTILPGSPAEAAGLKLGDRIVLINGKKPLDDPNDPVFHQPVGTVLTLEIHRNEASKVYKVTLRDMF